MKLRILLAILLPCLSAGAVEIIDSKTVYNPDLNTCMASFGGLITKKEVTELPGARQRIMVARQLLTQWIARKNGSGFYLSELDPSGFHWQFVESRSYMGVVLLIPSGPLPDDFYQQLGAGFHLPGHTHYSIDQPWNSKNDIFSFVIDKNKRALLHFENWKFSNGKATQKWMTQSTDRDL